MEHRLFEQETPSTITDLCADVRAWPLLADVEDLVQIPPMLLQSSDHDPLVSEIERFRDRISSHSTFSRVPVKYSLVPKTEHCDSIRSRWISSKASKQSYAEVVTFLKDSLKRPPKIVSEQTPTTNIEVSFDENSRESAIDVDISYINVKLAE